MQPITPRRHGAAGPFEWSSIRLPSGCFALSYSSIGAGGRARTGHHQFGRLRPYHWTTPAELPWPCELTRPCEWWVGEDLNLHGSSPTVALQASTLAFRHQPDWSGLRVTLSSLSHGKAGCYFHTQAAQCLRHPRRLSKTPAVWGLMAGEPGLEPGFAGLEPAVLAITLLAHEAQPIMIRNRPKDCQAFFARSKTSMFRTRWRGYTQ